MAKISPAAKKRFVDPELEGFVIANTEPAFEMLGPRDAEHPHCVVCGAELTNVFVTNYGPMGGDCYATLSGSPETRSSYRKIMKSLGAIQPTEFGRWSVWGQLLSRLKIDVVKDFHRSYNDIWIKAEVYDDHDQRWKETRLGWAREAPFMVEYLKGWAEMRDIPVVVDRSRASTVKNNPVPGVTDAKFAVLTKFELDDQEFFEEWAKEAGANDECLADRNCRAGLIESWLDETCNIGVRDDGLVQFWRLTSDDDCDVRDTIGGLPVVVYHHTATGALPYILQRGRIVPAVDLGYRPTKHNRGQYVYVTTEMDGPVVRGYTQRAIQRFGGVPVTLEIRTTLYELDPDPDDRDLSVGRSQFVLPYVDVRDIVAGLERAPKKPLRKKPFKDNPTLTPKDKAVIDAFLAREPRDGKILESSGDELRRVGVGAEVVAKWIDGNLVETSTESTKLDESILRYLRKKHRKQAVVASMKIVFADRVEPWGKMGTVSAMLAGKRIGKLEWAASTADEGKYTIQMIKVEDDYRRRGVATALYKAWMDREGIGLGDLASTNKTAEGRAFRRKVDRILPNPFDPVAEQKRLDAEVREMQRRVSAPVDAMLLAAHQAQAEYQAAHKLALRSGKAEDHKAAQKAAQKAAKLLRRYGRKHGYEHVLRRADQIGAAADMHGRQSVRANPVRVPKGRTVRAKAPRIPKPDALVGLNPNEHERTAAPVNWSEADVAVLAPWDEGTVSDFLGAPKDAVIYRSLVPLDELHPIVAEREEGAGQGTGYDWDELRLGRRRPPPIVVVRKPSSELQVFDGNHRTHFWKASGYEYAPAWVYDEWLTKWARQNKRKIKVDQ